MIAILYHSGHLARHSRIHTGEKNFHCLYPGCPSRFSRQDNMMQHYRTHMSPRSRRGQQRATAATTVGAKTRVPMLPPPPPPPPPPRPCCHAYIYTDASAAVHQLPLTCYPAVPPPTPQAPPRFMPASAATTFRNELPKPHVLEPSIRARASSVSSCSSTSSSLSSPMFLPPLNQPQPQCPQENPHHGKQTKRQSTPSDLLQLAYIVSTIG
ncbi:hypothetical protein BX666DRAFT_1868840 [Dichotomocladium elegans]|nr:hypothetical protein BX666DRAFT_1868840 [Dichotomocladium elegans]